MRSKVVVVDYGMGNLRSVSQAVLHAAQDLPFDVVVTQDPDQVYQADRVVLPGQGAMPDCMHHLKRSGLQDAVLDASKRKPLLGVCVGMQMLLDHSEEGDTPGLALIPGQVVKFQLAGKTQPDGSRYKVPQMGWNQVSANPQSAVRHPVLNDIPDGTWFYFVHSYYAQPTQPDLHAAALADYGALFCVAVARDNLFATQFHPEKSSAQGLKLYRNFLHWNP